MCENTLGYLHGIATASAKLVSDVSRLVHDGLGNVTGTVLVDCCTINSRGKLTTQVARNQPGELLL